MILLIILFTFVFVCISFISSLPENSSNFLIAYFISEITFILNNLIVFTLGYIVFVFLFIKLTNFGKNLKLAKKIQSATFYFFQISLLGFFLSLITLFLVAIIQLNIISLIIRVNPKIAGIENETEKIIKLIKTYNISPKIIISKEDNGKVLASISQASTGYDNLYGRYILQSVPDFLIIPNNLKKTTFILMDEFLIITRINFDDLEKISPIISHSFVKEYFGNKYVKSYPNVTILTNKEFQKYRQLENKKRIIKIDKQLEDINNYISTISAAINNDKLQIEKEGSLLNNKLQENQSQYERCIKYYEIDYCKTIVSNLNKKSQTDNSRLEEWNKQLEFDKSLLKVYSYYNDFFNLQKANLENFKDVIPNEQGVFEPENNIKARLDNKDADSIITFFSILVHEYFHYASYTKDKKFSNSFFEEALTEYFSRQVIKHNLNFDSNLGYPIQSKIISQFSQNIAENELIRIYFSKDDNQFAQTMDRVYGDGFYEKNKMTFEAMQYATTPNQLVKLANEIMQQIGGVRLSEKDFYISQKK